MPRETLPKLICHQSVVYLKRFTKQRKKFSTNLKNEKPNCVCLTCVSANVPGLEAVLRLGEVKDNDGAQQNKLFP